MRTIRPILIAVVLQAVVLAGWAGSSASPTSATATAADADPAPQLSCGKNERVCFSCDGSRQFCAQFCPDCIPPVRDPTTPSLPAVLALLPGGACAGQI